MHGVSHMAPRLSLVILKDLILIRLLLAIFLNSFGKNIWLCRLQINNVDIVYVHIEVLMLAEQIYSL